MIKKPISKEPKPCKDHKPIAIGLKADGRKIWWCKLCDKIEVK